MAEPTDGVLPAQVLSITMTPMGTKMNVSVSMPEQLDRAYVLWKMLGDAIFTSALNPEPDRMVKTPDELGMRVRPVIHRG